VLTAASAKAIPEEGRCEMMKKPLPPKKDAKAKPKKMMGGGSCK
jgi:hypothetical protein